MNVSFEPLQGENRDYNLYILFVPHIKNMGYENSGRVLSYRSLDFLTAWRENIAAVLTADIPFKKMSAGYSGYSDGWQDLKRDFRMDWIFERGVTASLSVPWGEARGDGEAGGYHLIWPRDLVKSAFAFMAIEDKEAPVRILKFLAETQKPDGSWPQNMWLDGSSYWHGVQLDEVAFPVMLAWRLKRQGIFLR